MSNEINDCNKSTSSYNKIKKNTFEKFTESPTLKITSILVALIAGAIGIYSFFQEKNIQLEYEII